MIFKPDDKEVKFFYKWLGYENSDSVNSDAILLLFRPPSD